MSKLISLTQGKVALVDDADFEWLNQWKWHACKGTRTYYAKRESPTILMHREILGLKFGDGIETDHRNGDGLDNRRENLRKCTNAENCHNRVHLCSRKSSIYKGVNWDKRKQKWQARTRYEGKSIFLGYYDSEIDAARAYDRAALKYFGEFAKPNFKEICYSYV